MLPVQTEEIAPDVRIGGTQANDVEEAAADEKMVTRANAWRSRVSMRANAMT